MRVAHDDGAHVAQSVPPRAKTHREDSSGGVAGDIARLQRAAGNRAVAANIDRLSTVQRHLGPTMPAEVGEPAVETAVAGPAPRNAVEPGTGTGTGTGAGTGTGTGTAPAAPALSRQAQVYAKLNTTDTGRWALGIIDKWSIPVNYNFAGVGSYHQGGSIFINQSLSIDAAALVTLHEAQHANTFKSGKQGDVTKLSRGDFIVKMIADEAEAVVRQIEGSVPMVAKGASLAGSGLTQGLIDKYRAAFYVKRDELEAADPKLTRAQINDRCRIFARDTEVTNWFHDGTFVTSTGGAANVTYSQHYGNEWDKVRNPPSASPAGGGA